MYAQIVIDCQTQKEQINCEYCIAKENCTLRLDLTNRICSQDEKPNSFLSLILLEVELRTH